MLTHVGTLAGHKGCVNRLAWSPGGDKLASVSDDTDIIVWGWEDGDYPPLRPAEGAPARPTVPAGPHASPGLTFGMRMLTRIDTGHTANVFGVKFLPYSNDRVLVTGGMDGEVRLHALDHGSVGRRRARTGSASMLSEPLSAATSPALAAARSPGLAGMSPSRTPGLSPSLPASRSPRLMRLEARFGARHPTSEHWFSELRYTHRARVKNVEVAPDCPHLFWSASEDSTVCQFDVRESVASQRPVLLTLAQSSDTSRQGWLSRRRAVSIKHMAINPVRPHLLALACGDSYLRVYDRRMLPALGVVLGKPSTGPAGGSSLLPGGWSHASSAAAHGNVLRFAPLHLAAEYPSPDIITPSMSYALQGLTRGPGVTGAGEGSRHPSLEPTMGASRSRRGRDMHATHVDWDESGRYLAGSYRADGVYEFDTLGVDAQPPQHGTEGLEYSAQAAGDTEMEACLSLPALRPSQQPVSFGRGCEHASSSAGLGSSSASVRSTTFRAHKPQAVYTEELTQDDSHACDVSPDPFSFTGLLPASVSSPVLHQPSATPVPAAGREAPSSVPAPSRPSLRQQLLDGSASDTSSSASLSKGPWMLKEAGNAAFRKGHYTHAIALYSAAIGLARSDVVDAQAARVHTGDVQSLGQQSSEPVEPAHAASPPLPSGAAAPQGRLSQRCNELGLALLYANRGMAYNKRGGGGDGADAVLDCARASSSAPLSWKVQLRLITSLQTAGHARSALAHARAFIQAWSAPEGVATSSITASDDFLLEIDRAVSQAREEEVKLVAHLRKAGEVTGPADVLQLLEERKKQREAEARGCAMATATDTPATSAAAGLSMGARGGGSARATGGRGRRNAWLRHTAAHSDAAGTAPPASTSPAGPAREQEQEHEGEEDERMSQLELHAEEAEIPGQPSSSSSSSLTASEASNDEETDGSESEEEDEEDEDGDGADAGEAARLPGTRAPVVPLLPTLYNAYKGWISTGVEPSDEPIALPSAPASSSPSAAAGDAAWAGSPLPAAALLDDPYEPALHCTRHAGRYVGHSNVQTDIKECAFWAGPAGPGHHPLPSLALAHSTAVQRALLAGLWAGKSTQDSTALDGEDADAPASLRDSVRCARGERGFILSGSDDGRLWVYDRATSLPIAALGADEDVLNAVRPHPTLPLIATSGIESVIRLWAPRACSAVDEMEDGEVSAPRAAPEAAGVPALPTNQARSAAGARHPLDQRPAALARLDLRAADVHALLEVQDRRVRSGVLGAAEDDEEEEGPFGGVQIPPELMRRLLAGALQAGEDDEGGAAGEGEGGAGTRVIRCANQ